MSNDVPLLPGHWLPGHCVLCGYDHRDGPICVTGNDIATGRAVVVPRMTEAEAMAMCAHNAGSADDYAINLDGYIAALRDIGVIRD